MQNEIKLKVKNGDVLLKTKYKITEMFTSDDYF